VARTPDGGLKVVITFHLLVGLSLCGYWATQITSGFLYMGISMVREGAYITWHVIAELLTGILALVAAYLMLTNHSIGKRLGMFVSGMLLYTGINSIGLGLNLDAGLLILAIICCLGAFFSLIYLTSHEEI